MTPALARLLDHAARRWPERVAVEDPERGVSADYRRLAGAAELVAAALHEAGVRPGDRVGLCAPKSVASVAALFGVLKAGAGYVPVDAGAPLARNAFILADCAVRRVIVERGLADGLRRAWGRTTPGEAPLAELSELGADLVLAEGPERPPSGDTDELTRDVAYVLYTSGSTGTPKGVVHTHRSARSFIDWCSEAFAPTPDDRFSSHAPFHFDLSILDLYVPLKHGARVVLLGEELGKQPARLAEVIAASRLTMWYSTPSILRLLVEFGHLEAHDHSALRWVLFAGEVFPPRHFRALRERWPEPRYANLYGPTETNVCTWYEVPPASSVDFVEPFPIGRACSNDRARVVDEHGRDVPAGQEGELVVTGGSVMRGYWNLPELTARSFLRDETGAAWYRTGDIVTEREEGMYVFVGRRDRMVKRRGYRVELGEIEAALHRHPDVREAAVLAFPAEDGVQVRAFVSVADGRSGSVIEYKRFCAEQLPLYMVPDRFTFLPELPRTSTDKTDYQRLREQV